MWKKLCLESYCGNGKYLVSTMDDSAIICDEVIESYNEKIKNIPTNFNEKNLLNAKSKFPHFTCIFINDYRNIDSC